MRKSAFAVCEQQSADQPAHLCSLISAFVVHCLDSIIPLLAIAEISRPMLVSSAEQAGLSLTWSQTPKTGFLMTGSYYVCVCVCVCKQQRISDKTVRMHRLPEYFLFAFVICILLR